MVAEPRTVAELLQWAVEEEPTAQFVSYPNTKFEYQDFTVNEFDRLTAQLAVDYASVLSVRESSATPDKVVGILGMSNIDYMGTIFALEKLGFCVLLFSTRLADAAYRHLLEKTGCRDVLVQSSFAPTMQRIKDSFHENLNVQPMGVLPAVQSVANKTVAEAAAYTARFDAAAETNRPAWIIHSSGSTGLPKPVGQSHIAVLHSARSLAFINGPLTGYITLPFFHTYGIFAVISSLVSHRRISLHNADLPLTAQNMLAALRAHEPQIFYCVPYSLKLLLELEDGIRYLKMCKLVISGGSSCPEELGNRLVDNGVALVSFYGSTEAGALMSSSRDVATDKEWSWLKLTKWFAPYGRMEPVTNELSELVVLSEWPSKMYTNRNDGAYTTRDLFERHPADPNKWRYVGRMDDTIVLSNGEKANPVPLELAARQAPLVQEVAVAGAERSSLILIIVPFKDLPRDQLLDHVWPHVQTGNDQVPTYARITREAVLILPAGTKYPLTDKGTTIRRAFLRQFAPEIDALYAELESIHNDPNAGLKLSREETREFVRDAFISIIGLDDPSELADDTDVFNLGLDSLQAATLWRKIARELNTGGKKVSQNIAFEKPTVNALAAHLYSLRTGEKEEEVSASEVMQKLVEKYSVFPKHVPGNVKVDGEYIVLTGATGSLGAHIVHQLVSRPNVRKVYCLNRASSPEKAQERTIASLKERQVFSSLSSEQLSKIASFPSDLSQETLGLTPAVFSDIVAHATCVIHCAWQVNFNMDVSSFESHHIRGAWNLLNMCLKSPHASPPSFTFCSSVSTVMASPHSAPIPEALPTSFDYAMPMGYARSKLVTEHICAAAAHSTGIAARVARIGQVAGDSHHGIWNATEAIPLTVQAAKTIGVLPVVPGDEPVSWLPVDVVAAATIEISGLPDTTGAEPKELPPKDGVFAVQHPRCVSWNNDFLPALREAGLTFEAVDQREWVRRLANSPQDPVSNPPTKLMQFFRGRYDKDQGDDVPDFSTELACKYSPSLRACPTPDAALMRKFLAFWQAKAW